MASHGAADRSDRTIAAWDPPALSADAEPPRAGADPGRHLHRNNGIAAGGLQTLKDNIIGHILRLRTKPDVQFLGWGKEEARTWSSHAEHEFKSWGKTAECNGKAHDNLLGLTLQALSDAIMNGVAPGIPMWLPVPVAGRWAKCIMLAEADRLNTPPWLQPPRHPRRSGDRPVLRRRYSLLDPEAAPRRLPRPGL